MKYVRGASLSAQETGRWGDHWLLGKQVCNACSLDSRISLQETQAQHEDIYLNAYDTVPALPGVGHLGLLKLPFNHRPARASPAFVQLEIRCQVNQSLA